MSEHKMDWKIVTFVVATFASFLSITAAAITAVRGDLSSIQDGLATLYQRVVVLEVVQKGLVDDDNREKDAQTKLFILRRQEADELWRKSGDFDVPP